MLVLIKFFERLEWFTQMSLEYHDRQRRTAHKQERFENERKLAYLNLIEEKEGEKLREEIPAEFMPMPGDVPPSLKTRGAFIFSDHGSSSFLIYSRYESMGRKI
jgi:hypothetical protein